MEIGDAGYVSRKVNLFQQHSTVPHCDYFIGIFEGFEKNCFRTRTVQRSSFPPGVLGDRPEISPGIETGAPVWQPDDDLATKLRGQTLLLPNYR